MRVRHLGWQNKIGRLLWHLTWLLLYRPSPTPLHAWRRLLLVAFGARIGKPAYLYPTARIWAPWNLRMGRHSTLAGGVDCYCVDTITLGDFTTVSQYSYLCSASHDYRAPLDPASAHMPLVSGPINLGHRVWITAGVFVGPGVSVGEGAVVLARSVVTRDLPAWSVCAGQPAVRLGPRELRSSNPSA